MLLQRPIVLSTMSMTRPRGDPGTGLCPLCPGYLVCNAIDWATYSCHIHKGHSVESSQVGWNGIAWKAW